MITPTISPRIVSSGRFFSLRSWFAFGGFCGSMLGVQFGIGWQRKVALAGGKRFPAGNAIAKIVRRDRSVDDALCEFQSRSRGERLCFALRRALSRQLS